MNEKDDFIDKSLRELGIKVLRLSDTSINDDSFKQLLESNNVW